MARDIAAGQISGDPQQSWHNLGEMPSELWIHGREKFRSSECHLIDSTRPRSSLDVVVAPPRLILSCGIHTVGSWSGSRKVFQIGRWRGPLEVWRSNRRFEMTRFRSNGRAALLGWNCRSVSRSDGIIGGTISKASSLSLSLRLHTVLLNARVLSAMWFQRANGFKR